MKTPSLDSFKARKTLSVGSQTFDYFSLSALSDQGFDLAKMPFSMKIFLENLLRHEDGETVTAEDIAALAAWPDPGRRAARERSEERRVGKECRL